MKPPYKKTGKILKLVASISEKIGEVNSAHLNNPLTELRKKNRNKSIQASLEIEGNTLTIEQITAILENKSVIGSKKEIIEVKKQIARIENIFPVGLKDNCKKTETLEIYKKFLNRNLAFPVELAGIEDFNWEEFYILVAGDKMEYELLKKTNPSNTDIFYLKSIDIYDEYYGLIANVIRKSDKMNFQIPLGDLKVTDKKNINYQLLDDYSVWCVNY